MKVSFLELIKICAIFFWTHPLHDAPCVVCLPSWHGGCHFCENRTHGENPLRLEEDETCQRGLDDDHTNTNTLSVCHSRIVCPGRGGR